MVKPSMLQRLGRLRKRIQTLDFKVMGLDPSPELVAISMVYFVQGILGLSRLAVSFFFKDELHIQPAEVAVLTGLSSIPWMVKPLYGFISDSVPLFGYRRRSYLVLCGLMGTAAWSTLAFGVRDAQGAVACMLLASLGTAASDVVVDSIVVERARGHHQSVAGSLQSLCWASSALGGILSAYFSGAFVQNYGCRFVFALTAFFPLAVSASSLLIDERPAGRSAVRRAVPLRKLLWRLMLCGAVLSSSQLILISGLHRQWGLSDQMFVLGDSLVLTVLGQVSFMPILVLAARMCPEGVEATLFATLMSVLNCGSITGGALGAGLTKLYGVTSDKYDNLFPLVATCIGLSLLPAPFLRLLPGGLDAESEAERAERAEREAAEERAAEERDGQAQSEEGSKRGV
ncbi:hypothetical protein GPECTOR_43g880 [Gonium pectorale]|uniref:Major facilitator superfamily (MFS) profile domain-containing protein n=1 Tax=Gonium pectorale TaxID=33097 RepID=A0A150G9C2_GONPE|nr:hypothetical protein GPECTOR_43g880 [Gonium pectorale]|eukprot:KXZ46444.1 hypothetical protein GPECTOR_43g880 [Gonium pectorale]